MRFLVFSLLFACSLSFAKGSDIPPGQNLTAIQVSKLYSEQQIPNITTMVDVEDRENKVSVCVTNYIEKQSKSYAKVVKNNLYDLIRNFDRIASQLYGKRVLADDTPYQEKIEALAKVQCEAYYTMGMLK